MRWSCYLPFVGKRMRLLRLKCLQGRDQRFQLGPQVSVLGEPSHEVIQLTGKRGRTMVVCEVLKVPKRASPRVGGHWRIPWQKREGYENTDGTLHPALRTVRRWRKRHAVSQTLRAHGPSTSFSRKSSFRSRRPEAMVDGAIHPPRTHAAWQARRASKSIDGARHIGAAASRPARSENVL